MPSQQRARILAKALSAISAKPHTAETVRQSRRTARTTKENRVKRSVTIAAAATAIVVVGLSGCSSDKKSTSSSSGGTSVAASGSSSAKVTIDGKDQTVQGTVACTSAAGTENIAIGGAQTGIGVVLTDASPPVVKSVGLGNVNGVTLGYTPGVPGAGQGHRDQRRQQVHDQRDRDRGGHGQPDAAREQVLRNRCDLPLELISR